MDNNINDTTDIPGLGGAPFTLIFDQSWFPYTFTYVDTDGNLQIGQVFPVISNI